MHKKTLTEEEALFVRSLCVRGFDTNRDMANDCFLYVWEKLHENEARRIRAFKGESSFRTFLYSITSKLIIDFRRSQFGYKVLPKYYWEFDEVNRYAFKLFFYQNLNPGWVENAIRAEFRITEAEAQIRVDVVEKKIRESRLKTENPSQHQLIFLGEETGNLVSENRRENPEENITLVEIERKRERLLALLTEEVEKLNAEDALILQLYFEQGLSAKEISGAIPGVKDKSIYKRIRKLLHSLRNNLKNKGITEEEIDEIIQTE